MQTVTATEAKQSRKAKIPSAKPKATVEPIGLDKQSRVIKTGRPEVYTDEIATEFCERIALGRSLRSVCDDPDMPSSTTVNKWARENGIFASRYAQAREDRGMNYGDKIGDMVDKVLSGEYPPDVARVAIDALKWTAARLAPKVYGDKQSVEINVDMGKTAAAVLMDLSSKATQATAIEHRAIDVTPTLIGENNINEDKDLG